MGSIGISGKDGDTASGYGRGMKKALFPVEKEGFGWRANVGQRKASWRSPVSK
jgi:hypothetical protein